MTNEQVVISGIAGKFPRSDNVRDFQKNLYNKVDCVTDASCRWKINNPDIPARIGTVSNISKLDNVFFGTNSKFANFMDPMIRLMLEQAYGAIFDAGINPRSLKGSRTGVFMGSCFSESESAMFYDRKEQNGFHLVGTSRTMLANRVSFFLGAVGPSLNVDSGFTSSCTALEQAYLAIKKGRCENAVVGGSNLILHPNMSLQLNLAGLLSTDGKTKSFDNNAEGYALSESIVAIFLQKPQDAKRIYAEVINVKSLHGPSIDVNSYLFPNSDYQAAVMKQALDESGLSPQDVSFIEADGQGIKEADANEANAIDSVFKRNSDSPLLIGSVKSNIGYTSASSTLDSIIKVVTMMETGFIPPNLHYTVPSEKIPALAEGRLRVVTETTPWQGTFAAINSTSYVGGFSNVILKAHEKEKKKEGQPEDNLSRLVMVSGRTEDAVDTILSDLENRPIDTEMLQLIYNIFEDNDSAHLYRGFTILSSHSFPLSQQRQIEHIQEKPREIWYIFSGMGSQWVGMGEDLMRLPVFAESVEKCDAVLKPRGIDIKYILTDKNPGIFDNVVNSFVGIATVQIGLVDVLKSVGIEPDFMIGHSVGEIGCAYADGCFTAEEMVLSALSRGLASVESDLQEGLMAAVGLGYERINLLCPSDIDIACRNSDHSSTISGPPKSVRKFITKLKSEGIFAKEVATSNIAYHSRYIAPAASGLFNYLQKIIPNPRPRTARWISTSVPRREWKTAKARLSSAEYHTNNLLSPVLFDEISKLIPADAIAIEIAPHGLLQAILKRSLPKGCLNVPLTRRGHKDNVEFLLSSFGTLYIAGLQPQIYKLYPKIEFPIGRGTPSISPLIKWEHSIDWYTTSYNPSPKKNLSEHIFEISLDKAEWEFLKGNEANGKCFIPFSVYLKLVWNVVQVFHKKIGTLVIFENVRIHKSFVEVTNKETLTLTVMVRQGDGIFEIQADITVLASGVICLIEKDEQNSQSVFQEFKEQSEVLSENEVYSELNMRGFQYSGCFKSIRKFSIDRKRGILYWQDDWITFLDGMIQLYVLTKDTGEIQLPSKLRRIVIDLQNHQQYISKLKEIPVLIDSKMNGISSGGVEVTGITLETIFPESSDRELKYETVKVVPDNNDAKFIPLSPHFRIVRNWGANQIRLGEVNSITWVQLPVVDSTELKKLVKVEYAGLNHSDIYQAMEKSYIEATERHRLETQGFGLEYSGMNPEGSRVMGIAKNTLSRYTDPDSEYTWTVPNSWTLEDAATVPVAYIAAYAAVCLRGGVQNGESILILNGGSSIGQAAINIALENKCKVITTYETIDEKKFLCSQYPDINENQVCCNRRFEDRVLTITQGKGVNVIIHNDSNLYNLEESLRCVKTSCKVIVVGELENALHESVGMAVFLKDIVLHSIVISKLINADVDLKRVLASMVTRGIANETVKPLCRRVYDMRLLKKAYVDSVSRKSNKKILIKIQSQSSFRNQILAKPKIHCISSKVYLIIGGLSDFGHEVLNFLIARGARNIIICSSTQIIENRFCELRRGLWNSCGINLIIRENLNLSEKQNVENLLKEAMSIGSVDGIFDLQRMKSPLSKLNEIIKCVNTITEYLDEESRNLCPDLSHFVICSAVINPNHDIKEHVSKESEVASLCERRIKNGIPGLIIFWDPISGISECTNFGSKNNLLSILKCINELDEIFGFDIPIVIVSKKDKIVKHAKNSNHNSVPTKEVAEEREAFEAYIYKVDDVLRAEL